MGGIAITPDSGITDINFHERDQLVLPEPGLFFPGTQSVLSCIRDKSKN